MKMSPKARDAILSLAILGYLRSYKKGVVSLDIAYQYFFSFHIQDWLLETEGSEELQTIIFDLMELEDYDCTFEKEKAQHDNIIEEKCVALFNTAIAIDVKSELLCWFKIFEGHLVSAPIENDDSNTVSYTMQPIPEVFICLFFALICIGIIEIKKMI